MDRTLQLPSFFLCLPDNSLAQFATHTPKHCPILSGSPDTSIALSCEDLCQHSSKQMASLGPFKQFFQLIKPIFYFCYVKSTLSFYYKLSTALSVFLLGNFMTAPVDCCMENYKIIKGGVLPADLQYKPFLKITTTVQY